MSDDDEDPPPLRVVSNNPNPKAKVERQTSWAREAALNAFCRFAAAILRTMAGSESESIYLFRRLVEFVDAHKEFHAITGQWLTGVDLRQALRLPEAELKSSMEDWAYREWIRERAMETIVQGSLRLAAHRLLGERPHFGGKNSERLIKEGIDSLEELKRTPFDPATLRPARVDLGPPAEEKMAKRGGRKAGFGPQDLKELKEAIKAKDSKRIAELTSKIGRSSLDDKPSD
jgi:hypothetical protein